MVKEMGKWVEKKVGRPSPFLYSIFNGEEKDARDFVKKLMGRIVFLYFVQKKRWLGATTTEYLDGPYDFIFQLFEETGGDERFFPFGLSELFFNALNRERPDDNWQMPSGRVVKIPFLNGGLFVRDEVDEKIHLKGNMLTFPPRLFSHVDKKDTPNDRGFLDFLNAYNFTVYENSENDHIVAVDPEMLGHIFENLLEDNKDKGAYYTPKEIVTYMCQESLIEYLTTHLSKEYKVYKELGNNQFELFGSEGRIQFTMLDEFGDKSLNRVEVEQMVKIKDIINLTKNQLNKIESLLNSVKICDPAIGSGAFPMGLLQEIYAIKEAIANKLEQPFDAARTKENIIQNSIYGVDIERGAVDIARLRFWLSLVVDEESPKALPNLDYKIVVGNSLVSKFNGEIIEIDWERIKKVSSADNYVSQLKPIANEISKKQHQFFNPENKEKKKITKEIRHLKLELLINQLNFTKVIYTQNNPKKGGFMPSPEEQEFNNERNSKIYNFNNAILELKKLQENPDEPFEHFDWYLDFPEILNSAISRENRGFDIVIGNPPYGAKLSVIDKGFFKKKYITTKTIANIQKGSLDSFTLFIELGHTICVSNGNLHYIVPISITSSDSMTGIHRLLENSCSRINVSSYAVRPQPVFKNAVVNTSILFFKKDGISNKEIFSTKMYRKNKEFDLKHLIENLEFIEVSDVKLSGRYPKISKSIEKNILKKILSHKIKIKNLIKDNGTKIYYRTTGGRYFKIITNYSTGSTKEKPIIFDKKYANTIGAILSSNLFFWYYQIYSNNLDLKTYEIESFGFPQNKIDNNTIENLENIYSEYLNDIEKNANVRQTQRYANISSFKEYKIGKSKHLIDQIDDVIGPLYDLTKNEIEFIKNYEIEFRLKEDEI
jgi:adenine-specific DNA-methyltransferase